MCWEAQIDPCDSRPYLIWPLDYLSFLISYHSPSWIFHFIFTFLLFLAHNKHHPVSSSILAVSSTCQILSQIHTQFTSSFNSGLSSNVLSLDRTFPTVLLRIVSPPPPSNTLYNLFMFNFFQGTYRCFMCMCACVICLFIVSFSHQNGKSMRIVTFFSIISPVPRIILVINSRHFINMVLHGI